MSTTIPYDPSLDLGNIVPPEHLEVLEKISTLQTPIDEAQNELNSLHPLATTLIPTNQRLAAIKKEIHHENYLSGPVGSAYIVLSLLYGL